ncbi:N-acetylglucosamine-6-phosphate deacetylase [Leucobacter sp. NPDC058333]|uniref:N-acetylglucosamine-6-phosphate deacetylase n=1 Tax=Leucobacter sp. NPDC058333 TaxID=3346450 RepID=UPI0036678800
MTAEGGAPAPGVTLAAARIVTADAVREPGWVTIAGSSIVAVGGGAAPDPQARDLGDVTVVPGFVDAHVHGGGGAGITDGTEWAALRSRDAHFAHGTTSSMASLVTASPQRLLDDVAMLAPLVANGDFAGIHLEGPWLSQRRAGAHDPALLRAPDAAEIAELLAAGRSGTGNAVPTGVSLVTIAPELRGAMAAIEQFVEAGVVVAIGHTDADYDTTRRAIDAGATVATHLFNAMPALHHREPGPVLALLNDPRVTLELVADGVHLHPDLMRWVVDVAGPERVALVTDAMAAAACGDGAYRLGALDVEVRDGVARLAGDEIGAIAGSTATMDALFRAALGAGPVNPEALRAAVQMTATTPARALGWTGVGDLTPGLRADLVVLCSEHRVTDVMRSGRWLSEAENADNSR